MLNMFMETLGPLTDHPEGTRSDAEEYVALLTGKDTWFQMEAFAAHIARLGGKPATADDYKAEFLVRLQAVRSSRLLALQSGDRSVESLLVPGSFSILTELQNRGITLYLSSGTDHEALVMEAELLRLTPYFEKRILGAGPGGSTKPGLLARLVKNGVPADKIVFFGDGQVEIAAVSEIGGIGVGLATDEPECLVTDSKKRIWLTNAGASFIVPNYLPTGLVEAVIPSAL